MRLVASLKLVPTVDQRTALLATLERVNAAANWLSALAWEKQVFRQYALHRLAYFELRARFGLSAQAAVRTIAKVADAYKVDRKTKRAFRHRGATAYDSRILTFKEATVSIWTLGGRQEIPYLCGKRQRKLLVSQRGESDLDYRDGTFYLLAACEVAEPKPYEPEANLGVDFGVVNLATDSTGAFHSGEAVDRVRRRYDSHKARLQRRGTRSAKRRLRRTSGKEAHFRRQENHRIAKELVAKARRHRAAIVLEDLTHIRRRTTVRKGQRRRHASWAFAQLRKFVTYKAALAGVPVVLVDPRKTSQQCPECGHTARSNRRSRDWFSCKACGHAAPADHTAARVIAARADVGRPIVAACVNALRSHELAASPCH